MSLINNLALGIFKRRLKSIETFKSQPTETQNSVFKNLILIGKSTQYFKQFSKVEIQSVGDFRKAIPITDYPGLQHYIERMRKGEENVLWKGKVKWYAKSSGTTAGRSKFIPVSDECLQKCHYQGTKDVSLLYLRTHGESKLLTGKALTLGGSHQTDETSETAKYGDLSAVMIQNSPFYAELVREPNKTIALIPNFEEKVEAICRQTASKNIVSFAGVPSWNLVLMKRILEYTGKSHLLELWPNLEVFFHGGVSFTPYKEQYKKIIPSDKMHYMETYNASEGFFAIQDDPSDSAMLLLLDNGIFYEFLELSKLNDSNPQTCTIEEVKTGINYAILISTNAGLWRYLIGDTVTFTSLYPHKIKITGRTSYYINVFGEELIASNAEAALDKACQISGASVSEYTVAPIFMDETAKGAHEWLIEFEDEPKDFEYFAKQLDDAIREINSDYDAKRSNNTTLRQLKLTVLPKGSFYKWMESRGKLGGQNKVPRLYNTRIYAEELLMMVHENQ